MKTILIALIAALLLGGGWYVMKGNSEQMPSSPNEEGQMPTNNEPAAATYSNADTDKIVVTTPQPGASVGHTFTVTGEARGGWYFEASFPLEVHSASGANIAQMPVQAQGEWMTTEFVPFSVDVMVPASYTGVATLVLRNDNPSGLPENDASVSIPIIIQ